MFVEVSLFLMYEKRREFEINNLKENNIWMWII